MGDNERYLGRWTPPDLEVLVGNAPQNLPGYFGMTKRLDDAFGRIMDALYSLGLSDDTAVLYTSDHGNHFRTRNREYKRSCHESSIRVPGALIGGPFTGGGRVNQLVSTINIAPTLLDAAGLEIPSSFEGQSLLPIVKREPIDWPDDVLVQLSEDDVGRAIRTDRWKYGVLAPQAHGWHDQDAETYEETQLYDLHADPYELNNLAGMTAFAEVATELRQRLIDRIREIEGKAVTINPAPSKHSGRRALIHWNSDTTDSGNALL